MNKERITIKLMPRIFAAILASLYLGLSLYAINCTFHCETLSVSEGKHSHSQSAHHSGHDHGKNGDSSSTPVSGDMHLCKISQRSVSQTVASSQGNIIRIDIGKYPLIEKSFNAMRDFDKSDNPSRAPPVV